MDIYKQIDQLQTWIRENQVKDSDDTFMQKVQELRALMNKAYNFK